MRGSRGPGWGSSGGRSGRGRPCTGGAAPPSPCPPTSQPETLTVIPNNQCFEFTTGVISMLALLFWRRQRSRGRYKALELLWAFAGPQRHTCLLPCPIAIAAPMFATLAPSTLCRSFLLSTSCKQCCCRPSMTNQPPLANGSTSWQVTPCMNFSYGAECGWMEETASNFLISCPPPGRCLTKSFCSKVPLSQMQVVLRRVIPPLTCSLKEKR